MERGPDAEPEALAQGARWTSRGARRTARPMNAVKRRAIFERLRAADPSPTTELAYSTPFELLIAVILSAQATDVSVNKATRTLFPAAPTPGAMLALGEEGVRAHIRNIGLFNAKAKNVGRDLPAPRRASRRRGAVRARGAGEPAGCGAQDRERGAEHRVRRPGHRGRHPHLPGRQPDPARPRQDPAGGRGRSGAFPPRASSGATPHHWLILHGRYVCTARKPACGRCLIADLCEYRDKEPG